MGGLSGLSGLTGLSGVAGGRKALLPYSLNIAALDDGTFPAEWTGALWTIVGGKALTTPGLGGELLTDPGLEATYTGGKCNTFDLTGTPTMAQSADVHGGAKAQQLVADAIDEHLGFPGYNGVTAGVWFQSSVWGKRTGGTGGNVRIYMWRQGASSLWKAAGIISAGYTQQVLTFRHTVAGWLVYSPCWQIAAGGYDTVIVDDASLKAITLANCMATVDRGASNINLIAPPIDTYEAETQAGVVIGLDSTTTPANFILAYVDGWGNVVVDKCVGGTWSALASVAAAYGSTKYFSVKKTGSTVSVYYGATDFGTLISEQTVSDAGIVNNTRHGLFSTNPLNKVAGTFSLATYAA